MKKTTTNSGVAIWSSRFPMCDLPGPWGLFTGRTYSQSEQETEISNPVTIGECVAGLRASEQEPCGTSGLKDVTWSVVTMT